MTTPAKWDLPEGARAGHSNSGPLASNASTSNAVPSPRPSEYTFKMKAPLSSKDTP